MEFILQLVTFTACEVQPKTIINKQTSLNAEIMQKIKKSTTVNPAYQLSLELYHSLDTFNAAHP
jgi:hypothetical protein